MRWREDFSDWALGRPSSASQSYILLSIPRGVSYLKYGIVGIFCSAQELLTHRGCVSPFTNSICNQL